MSDTAQGGVGGDAAAAAAAAAAAGVGAEGGGGQQQQVKPTCKNVIPGGNLVFVIPRYQYIIYACEPAPLSKHLLGWLWLPLPISGVHTSASLDLRRTDGVPIYCCCIAL